MTAPARRAAHDVLRSVALGREDLSTAIDRSRRSVTDPRDRALLGDIAVGVCRWRGALDTMIGQLSSRAISAIEPPVLDILRAAVYQIAYLDRVPAYAVVADAVSLARDAGRSRASRFVNAVLRTLADRRRPVALPAPPVADAAGSVERETALDYLGATLSHPRWLAARWLDRYGWTDAAAWARFNNRAAPVVLRPDLTRGTRDTLRAALAAAGIQTVPTRLAAAGLVVTDRADSPSWPRDDGRFVIQAEGSQLIVDLIQTLVDSTPDAPILDLCAAPGGKTVGIAGCRGAGLVVASDRRPRRVSLLSATRRRHQLPNVAVVRLDAERPLPFSPMFGGVLLDAPCSGLGVIRRDPDIRWRRHADDLPNFADRQFAMLTQAAATVRAGGWLVYATCSSEPEENEGVIRRFLAADGRFRLARPAAPALSALLGRDHCLRTLPFRDRIDAFFAAVVRRRIP